MPYLSSGLAVKEQLPPHDANRAAQPTYELHYQTDDAIATVEAANYFNPGAAFFGRGVNVLQVIAGVGGTVVGRTYIAVRDVNNVITLTRFGATAVP